MRIAGVQMNSGRDVDRNIARAAELAGLAADQGAKVIGFPSLCLTPWFPRQAQEAHFSLAQPYDGAAVEALAAVSLKHQTVIILPFFEAREGAYYNSAAVIDCGSLLGVSRKVHLPDIPLYREQFYFRPGEGDYPVFATTRGRIGVQICWDNLFPEGTRILALKGAEIVLAPTAASQDGQMHWERAITANAFANNLFIFRVNRAGRDDGLTFYGRSFCADPWGDMVSEVAGSRESIVLAEIDLAERQAAQETWGFLRHRRPDTYGDLVK